ncbi:MAG: glutamyl-tRNA reductase [Acidimicrobiales bacterium]|nr:glutamyl-tRNA reductase [Actinomycetota bacterium]
MSVVVVGLEQKQAPLELLERVAIPDEMLGKALASLARRPNLAEVVVLSTCLRTELYAVVERFHEGVEELQDYLIGLAGGDDDLVSSHLTVRFDDEVVNYLFEVASGLRSSLLGETEVLGQVRRALERAQEERASGPVLEGLFRRAVQAGRRVRASTSISRGTTSLAHAAVELAGAELAAPGPTRTGIAAQGTPQGLAGRNVVVIGAGTMATGVVEALAGLDPPCEVVVANRTPGRARSVASLVEGRGVPLAALGECLADADAVFVATGAPAPVLHAEVLGSPPGSPRRRVVVDLGVPRDVDPAVGEADGVSLLDMDDLTAFTSAAMAGREAEVADAARIVAEEVERYYADVRARGAAPIVAALRSHVEAIREAEIARRRKAGSAAGDEQWDKVDELTRSVIAKVLHEPSMVLKESAGTPRGERLAEAVRLLFGL